MEHILRVEEDDDRGYFECDCGRGGSGDSYTIYEQAERHIDFDTDTVKYRYFGA